MDLPFDGFYFHFRAVALSFLPSLLCASPPCRLLLPSARQSHLVGAIGSHRTNVELHLALRPPPSPPPPLAPAPAPTATPAEALAVPAPTLLQTRRHCIHCCICWRSSNLRQITGNYISRLISRLGVCAAASERSAPFFEHPTWR